jgi:hypothetical protein
MFDEENMQVLNDDTFSPQTILTQNEPKDEEID